MEVINTRSTAPRSFYRSLLFCLFMVLMQFMPVDLSAQKVGVGTITPAFKLDVRGGDINTDSLYRIATFRVLSIKGVNNLFVGKDGGIANTGSNNSFGGNQSGFSNTDGSGNTAFGFSSLYSNTSGDGNVAVGNLVLENNTLGVYNSSIGYNSMNQNLTGSYNAGFGVNTLTLHKTG